MAYLASSVSLDAQCPPTGCDITISGSSSTDYFLATGDTLCLIGSADYTGIVTLEGGVLINCATNPQTFGITPDGSFPQSDIFNYGTINENASSNFDKCNLYNYGTYHDLGDWKVQVNSQIFNYGTIYVDGKLDFNVTTLIDNSGTINSTGKFTNNGTFNVMGGCLNASGDFVNTATFNGTLCGTITISGTSDNSGNIIGTLAIIDPSQPIYPFVDVNTGTVGGSVIGTSCGCPGVPEDCTNGIDDDGDGLVDCQDPECSANDSDGDEICSPFDLDEDNDGIPDADEAVTIEYSNGDFNNGLTDWTSANFSTSGSNYVYADINCGTASLSRNSPCSYPRVDTVSFDLGWNNGNSGCTGGNSATLLDLSIGGTVYLNIRTPDDGGTNVDNATDQGGDALVTSQGGATFTISSPSVQGPQYIDHSLYLSWSFVTITLALPTTASDATILFSLTTLADDIAIDNVIITSGHCELDTDNDGVLDYLDIDSDNDGIYDLVEAGHSANDLNTDGMIDGVPGDFGSNGLFDAIETSADSGMLNYVITDSDSDGNINAIESDADNDGCNDIVEGTFTDFNQDGILGDNPVTIDGNGKVTSGIDGYTSPGTDYTNVAVLSCIEICGNSNDDNGDGRVDELIPGGVADNLILWLKADIGFSPPTWLDQSPYQNDATIFGDPGPVTNSLNFNTGINFDGDDHVEVNLPELVFDGGTHHAVIFAVYKPSTSSSAIGILGNQGTSNGTIELYNNMMGVGFGSTIMSSAYGNTHHLITYTIDEEDNVGGAPFSSPFYHNGTLQNSVTFNETNTAQTSSIFSIGKSGSWGGSLYFQGDIHEVIIYYENNGNSSISDDQRIQIESYLALKYGISLTHDFTDSQ